MIAKDDCWGQIQKIKLTNLYRKAKELTGNLLKIKFMLMIENHKSKNFSSNVPLDVLKNFIFSNFVIVIKMQLY